MDMHSEDNSSVLIPLVVAVIILLTFGMCFFVFDTKSKNNAICDQQAKTNLLEEDYTLYRTCYTTPRSNPCFCYDKIISSRR